MTDPFSHFPICPRCNDRWSEEHSKTNSNYWLYKCISCGIRLSKRGTLRLVVGGKWIIYWNDKSMSNQVCDIYPTLSEKTALDDVYPDVLGDVVRLSHPLPYNITEQRLRTLLLFS